MATDTAYYYLPDHLGSAVVVANGSGSSIQEESDFYPWGGERVIADHIDNRYKFASYEWDPESGNHYAVFRQYSSRLGRFMSVDPLGGDAVDSQSLNSFAYALNDPIDYDDPFGLSCTIVLNNSLNLLSSDQLQTLSTELQRILNLTNADVTVGTTSGSENNFDLAVSHNPASLNPNLSNETTVGYTIPLPGGGISNRGYVFTDVLTRAGGSYPPFGQNSLALGTGAGRAGFHEFLHNVLQVGNAEHVSNTPFQSGFTAEQYFGANQAIWNPSNSQAAAIRAKCGTRQPAGGSGRGGGARTGGRGGSGGFWIGSYARIPVDYEGVSGYHITIFTGWVWVGPHRE